MLPSCLTKTPSDGVPIKAGRNGALLAFQRSDCTLVFSSRFDYAHGQKPGLPWQSPGWTRMCPYQLGCVDPEIIPYLVAEDGMNKIRWPYIYGTLGRPRRSKSKEVMGLPWHARGRSCQMQRKLPCNSDNHEQLFPLSCQVFNRGFSYLYFETRSYLQTTARS